MSVQLKTMAIKCHLANKVRSFMYSFKYLDKIPEKTKQEFFDQLYKLNHEMHWELINYKIKRKDQKKLMEKRLVAPQTKSMKKKVRKYGNILENKE